MICLTVISSLNIKSDKSCIYNDYCKFLKQKKTFQSKLDRICQVSVLNLRALRNHEDLLPARWVLSQLHVLLNKFAQGGASWSGKPSARPASPPAPKRSRGHWNQKKPKSSDQFGKKTSLPHRFLGTCFWCISNHFNAIFFRGPRITCFSPSDLTRAAFSPAMESPLALKATTEGIVGRPRGAPIKRRQRLWVLIRMFKWQIVYCCISMHIIFYKFRYSAHLIWRFHEFAMSFTMYMFVD